MTTAAQEDRSSAAADWTARSVLLLAALGAVLVHRDFGLSWDEEAMRDHGRLFWDFLASGGRDHTFFWREFYHLHGAFFSVTSWLLEMAFGRLPAPDYELRHLYTLSFALLGLWSAWRIGRLISPWTGVLSILFLLLVPSWVGHAFFNPKDIPFAGLFMLSLWHIIQCHRSLPERRPWLHLRTGVLIGLTMGTRFAGVVLLVYFLLALSCRFLFWRRDAGRGKAAASSWLAPAALVLLSTGVVSLFFWPYPLLAPFKAVHAILRFPPYQGTVFFDGAWLDCRREPRSYLPLWIAMRLPDAYFLTVALAAVAALHRLTARTWIWPDRDRAFVVVALAFAAGFPVLSAVLLRPVIYDGMRHFLFVLPPLAVLAAAACRAALASFGPVPRTAIALCLAASAGIAVSDMAALHPLEYVHYNRTVAGGVGRGTRLYEGDYWGLAYREGVDWLRANVEPPPGRPLRVSAIDPYFLTEYFLSAPGHARDGFAWVPPGGDPDYVLVSPRWDQHKAVAGTVAHAVTRLGSAPLLYVVRCSE